MAMSLFTRLQINLLQYDKIEEPLLTSVQVYYQDRVGVVVLRYSYFLMLCTSEAVKSPRLHVTVEFVKRTTTRRR